MLDCFQELEASVYKRDKDKKELIERSEDFEQMAMKRLEKVTYLLFLFLSLLFSPSFRLLTYPIFLLFTQHLRSFSSLLLNLFFLQFYNTLSPSSLNSYFTMFPTVLMYYGILVLDPFFRSTSASVRIRCGTKKNSVGSTVRNRRSPANGRHTSVNWWKRTGFW